MRYFLTLVMALSLFYKSYAQDSLKTYHTSSFETLPPVIDGKETDKAWAAVEWAGDFVQREPNFGIAPSEETKFKILYDAKNLYVLIRAFDREPDKIVKRMSRRDGFDGDFVEINIDSYHDKRTAFSFTASVSGVKGDEYVSNNGDNWDETWDPIWYLATSIDDEGWIAEFRIPLSQLRFADVPEHTWGVQFTRFLFRKEERSTWQPIAQDAPGWVHLFGEMKGVKGIKPQKQLEIQPYVVASMDRFPTEEGNPFATGEASDVNVGVDAKIGITSDITLDLTINPDFGQVEADPSQVNLSAFRLFFRERRPFFLEGNNVLDFPIVGFDENNLFYSRQIGGRPSYYPEADFVNIPAQTQILGAAKLSGKNKDGFSWAILESLTRREEADVIIDGQEDAVPVEPMTNYLIGRFQQDIKEGETVVGAMLTSTHRFIEDPELSFLHNEAYSGGIDIQHNFKDRKYGLNFRTVFSNVQGSQESILLTQEASERFFQRPDNRYKEVDSTRRSLTGTGGTLSFGKQTGNWIWEVGNTFRSPELALNDAGFLSQTDTWIQWLFTQYRVLKPVGIFRFMRMNFIQFTEFDFGGTNLSSGYELFYGTQFQNYWRLNTQVRVEGSQTSNADLRGGPAIKYPGGTNWWYWLGTNQQKKIAFGVNQWFYWGFNDYTRNNGVNVSMTLRPTDALNISLAPSFTRRRGDLQYISTIDSEDGQKYLLGTVRQRIYRMTIRANYNITPNLTVEYWGQPFIASGYYSEFKEVREASHKEYVRRFNQFADSQVRFHEDLGEYDVFYASGQSPAYRFSNPDFNVREFRSNMVLRWEYVPGSTLFLVWASNGSDNDQQIRDGFSEASKDFFRLKSRNTLLIKYTYRFIL
jgi:hypothetical protein